MQLYVKKELHYFDYETWESLSEIFNAKIRVTFLIYYYNIDSFRS